MYFILFFFQLFISLSFGQGQDYFHIKPEDRAALNRACESMRINSADFFHISSPDEMSHEFPSEVVLNSFIDRILSESKSKNFDSLMESLLELRCQGPMYEFWRVKNHDAWETVLSRELEILDILGECLNHKLTPQQPVLTRAESPLPRETQGKGALQELDSTLSRDWSQRSDPFEQRRQTAVNDCHKLAQTLAPVEGKIRVGNLLGRGAHKNIYELIDRPHDVLAISYFEGLDLESFESSLLELLTEIRIKFAFPDSRILKPKSLRCTQVSSDSIKVEVIYPRYSTDLSNFVKDNPLFSTSYELNIERDNFVRKAAKQLCQTILTLHGMKIFHRDIKPKNIFLDQSENLVLGDFGLALDSSREWISNGVCGTKGYFIKSRIVDSWEKFKSEGNKALYFQESKKSDYIAFASTLAVLLRDDLPNWNSSEDVRSSVARLMDLPAHKIEDTQIRLKISDILGASLNVDADSITQESAFNAACMAL